jgi:hypothetical protein
LSDSPYWHIGLIPDQYGTIVAFVYSCAPLAQMVKATFEGEWVRIADVPWGLAMLGRPRAGEWLQDEIAYWAENGLTDVVSGRLRWLTRGAGPG